MELDFYKLHLNGHDFILVNAFRQPLPEEQKLPVLASRMCNRWSGVGARGILFLYPGEEHQARIVHYHRSGEEGPAPADGILCAARYAFDFGLAAEGTTVLENRADSHSVQCIDGAHFRYSLEIPSTVKGKPLEEAEDLDLSVRVQVGSRSLSCTALKFRRITAAIYSEEDLFSERSSIKGFESYAAVGYRVYTRDELSIFFRSREEGDAVEGAAAAATAAVLGGFCDRDVVIHYGGGKFLYEWNSHTSRVFITGSPAYVFTGTYELDDEELFVDY